MELSKIAELLAADKLNLNLSKSKLLVFSNRCITKKNHKAFNIVNVFYTDIDSSEESDTNFYIHGEKLKEVDHTKYLGALIDKNLNWSYHINAVSISFLKVQDF